MTAPSANVVTSFAPLRRFPALVMTMAFGLALAAAPLWALAVEADVATDVAGRQSLGAEDPLARSVRAACLRAQRRGPSRGLHHAYHDSAAPAHGRLALSCAGFRAEADGRNGFGAPLLC
jgi:hypothetical protein